MTAFEDAVHDAIADVKDPCSVFHGAPLNLFDLGMVDSVSAGPSGDVRVELLLDDPTCIFYFDISRQIEEKVMAVEGVSAVQIDIVADELWTRERMSDSAVTVLQLARARHQ